MTANLHRVVIFGYGAVGQSVVHALMRDERVVVCGVIEPSVERQRVLQRDYPSMPVANDETELEKWKPNVACVVSSNQAHADNVEKALLANCHIYLEKPIGLSLRDGRRILNAAARQPDLKISVNFSLRYSAASLMVKSLLDNDEIGLPVSVWSNRQRGFGFIIGGKRAPQILNPMISGGWAIHHACHQIDLHSWLIDSPMQSVYATCQSTGASEHSEEIVWALFRHSNEVTSMIGDHVGLLRDHHFGVMGERGSIIVSGDSKHSQLRIKSVGSDGEQQIIVDNDKQGMPVWNQFLKSIDGEASIYPSAKDGFAALRATLAIHASAAQGVPVSITDTSAMLRRDGMQFSTLVSVASEQSPESEHQP